MNLEILKLDKGLIIGLKYLGKNWFDLWEIQKVPKYFKCLVPIKRSFGKFCGTDAVV